MRYLLDTNIFIYAAIDRDSLSRDVKAILEDYDNSSANSPSTSEIEPHRKTLSQLSRATTRLTGLYCLITNLINCSFRIYCFSLDMGAFCLVYFNQSALVLDVCKR